MTILPLWMSYMSYIDIWDWTSLQSLCQGDDIYRTDRVQLDCVRAFPSSAATVESTVLPTLQLACSPGPGICILVSLTHSVKMSVHSGSFGASCLSSLWPLGEPCPLMQAPMAGLPNPRFSMPAGCERAAHYIFRRFSSPWGFSCRREVWQIVNQGHFGPQDNCLTRF